MKQLGVIERLRIVLDAKKGDSEARLFVVRDDGITVYDSVQDKTTASVAALVSGLWQASEALMGLVSEKADPFQFRLGFDTSSEGVYLFPLQMEGKRYFFGAIYHSCLNPGLLKRQVTLIKNELEEFFPRERVAPAARAQSSSPDRQGYLFNEITDEEIDRLFSAGGN